MHVTTNVDLDLLERWLTGWSCARGLPLPQRDAGGLVAQVGWPDQLRRHVFVDAGPDLQALAARVDEALVHLKAAVTLAQLRAVLPATWVMETQRYLMARAQPMPGPIAVPSGFTAQLTPEHGAHALRLLDSAGATAAIGRVVPNGSTAVFDRIETFAPYARQGLGTAIMALLDELAQQHGVTERLLVATEAGRALYSKLGWELLAPYATAILDPAHATSPAQPGYPP